MYTRAIILHDVMTWDADTLEGRLETFRKLEARWGKRRRAHSDAVYSRVENPVTEEITKDPVEDYIRLFHRLLDHDLIYELSVKNPEGKTWTKLKVYPEDFGDFPRFIRESEDDISTMADIASKDKRKDFYLEVKFCGRNYLGEAVWPEAVIEFREHDGKIIGYQVSVPERLSNTFDVRMERKTAYAFNHGMWVPEEYMHQETIQ